MKASKYNYFVPLKENIVIYNGLTDCFFEVPLQRAELYRTIINNPNNYLADFSDFFKKLEAGGFVIADDVEEKTKVREKYKLLSRPNQYYLMILPTYQCNLRCWYCIQDHANVFMSNDVINRVKKLITRKLNSGKITEFHLSWFGGEPLIAYDTLLELTKFAQSMAQDNNIRFSSSITTNGTLLTSKRIKELREAGVKHYQITIDGDPETHDSVKELKGASAYAMTMTHVNEIAEQNAVSLRFNYTKENLKPKGIVEGIKRFISPQSRKNITFVIHKVWQEDEKFISEEEIDELIKLSNAENISHDLVAHGFCYTDYADFDCIFPNGRVGKCDNHQLSDFPGILERDGNIKWEKPVEAFYNYHVFSGKGGECEECKYLPVCWGPCAVKREKMIEEQECITCLYGSERDRELSKNIIQLVKTKKKVIK
ncbi:MAG: radical SAM protein [Muribaculaceae bacterium]|nr:radical SAM protein [Muribaculaceae bacterium]